MPYRSRGINDAEIDGGRSRTAVGAESVQAVRASHVASVPQA
jgi:hypothetical protein